MTKLEKAQEKLINILKNQVVDLTMMSKIELGDDAIEAINDTNKEISELKTEVQQYTKGKVIAVDFDGVIHGYSDGWKDGIPYDYPVFGAREALTDLIDQGYHVMIYTTRCNHDLLDSDRDRVKDVKDYLNQYNIPFNEIYTGNGKPKATMYIDDRAISFKGNWNETLNQVKTFKTWNRPDAKSSAES